MYNEHIMKWQTKKQIAGHIKGGTYLPLIEQLLLQRGITSREEAEAFLHPDYDRDVHDPYLFVDMPKVVKRIGRAIKNNEKVGIFGDHDVDGVSGATVLADGFEALGLSITVYIPDKHSEGHGINTTAIDAFARAGVTLMVSVDCGMTNVEEVAYAKDKGIETIIIDHHHVPRILPDAVAIINPQMEDSGYPFKGLCGTGAAFKVVQALYQAFLPEDVEGLKWMLDIVGVGTVADCMPLLGENRTLVKYGLLVLSKTRRIGYQEMIRIGNMPIDENRQPTTTTIAFHIAPRINAAGRMAHARDAFDLLREKDPLQAAHKAQEIEEKNNARRTLTDQLVKKAQKVAKENFSDKPFIFIHGKDYPIGVVGIVAGRLASTHRKPVGVCFVEDGVTRCSFRSPKTVHMVEVLEETAQYLEKFGGHAAAAGATIKNENVDAFIKHATLSVEKKIAGKNVEAKRIADISIMAGDIDIDFVQELKKFEPFGQDNPEPLFHITGLRVAEARTVGKDTKHLKLTLTATDAPKKFDAIGFGFGKDRDVLKPGTDIALLAHIQENEWNGNVSIQFNIVDWRAV